MAPGEVIIFLKNVFLEDIYNNLKESCLSSQIPNNVISHDTEIIIKITSLAIYEKFNVFNRSITQQKSEGVPSSPTPPFTIEGGGGRICEYVQEELLLVAKMSIEYAIFFLLR